MSYKNKYDQLLFELGILSDENCKIIVDFYDSRQPQSIPQLFLWFIGWPINNPPNKRSFGLFTPRKIEVEHNHES